MRLFEIVSPPLYLASDQALQPGEITQETHAFDLGVEREGVLEKRRPAGKLARGTSLALHESPDKDALYVYAVQPLGQIDRLHTSWLKRLGQCLLTNEGEMELNAGGFWGGSFIPEDRDAPWEYRVGRAKVLKRVGGTALRRVDPVREVSPT